MVYHNREIFMGAGEGGGGWLRLSDLVLRSVQSRSLMFL